VPRTIEHAKLALFARADEAQPQFGQGSLDGAGFAKAELAPPVRP